MLILPTFESICAYIVLFELHSHSVICREGTIPTLQKKDKFRGVTCLLELHKFKFIPSAREIAGSGRLSPDSW